VIEDHPAGALGPWVSGPTVYPKVWDAITAAKDGITLADIRKATGLKPMQCQRSAMRMVEKGLAIRTRTMAPFPMYIMNGPRKGQTTVMRQAWLYQSVDNVR
jgi:hypothetical protein